MNIYLFLILNKMLLYLRIFYTAFKIKYYLKKIAWKKCLIQFNIATYERVFYSYLIRYYK